MLIKEPCRCINKKAATLKARPKRVCTIFYLKTKLMKKYFDAIVFCNGRRPLKYHAIQDSPEMIAKFCRFLDEKHKTWEYINFYNRRTKDFDHQHKREAA